MEHARRDSQPSEEAPSEQSPVDEEVPKKEEKAPRLFAPEPDWVLWRQGAEARLWKVPALSAICKERFPKRYRHPTLDARLTKQRCRMEARLLEKCRALGGISVPKVLQVDTQFADATALIYLECIDGITVRDYLEEDLLQQLTEEESVHKSNGNSAHPELLHELARAIGTTIALLHAGGMVHGDLTTSNMMMKNTTINNDGDAIIASSSSNLVLIDFGLAKNTTAAEERAVDLYVLERALQSTHSTLPESFLETVLSAYANHDSASKHQKDTLIRLEKVRQRGRKRECFG